MTSVLNFVNEKEKRTLEALMTTPATYRDVVVPKMAFVFVMCLVSQALVLLVNQAYIGDVPRLVLLMFLGAAIGVFIGLLVGLFSATEPQRQRRSLSSDGNSLSEWGCVRGVRRSQRRAAISAGRVDDGAGARRHAPGKHGYHQTPDAVGLDGGAWLGR